MRTVLGTIFTICAALIVLSLATVEIPVPQEWLLQWTSWVASVVAIVVSARVFWTGAEALRTYVHRCAQGRDREA